MESLHEKYRPRDLNEVMGHHEIVTSLENTLTKGTSQAFILAGPSGVGKTTLARIASAMVGCDPQNIIEIDAATHTGVDAMRAVAEAIGFKPFGLSNRKSVIIDEAHGLSRQAWDTLLKVVEKPPKHALWFFCTTNLVKLPQTIKTRCTTFNLKLLPDRDIKELVQEVIGYEKIKVSSEVVGMIVNEARGSPRQALVNLAMCAGVKSRKEAAELLRVALESDATIELCRFLMKPGSWMKAQAIISKLEDQSPEGVRIVVANYMASVLKGARSDREACHALSILEAFAIPYNATEGLAPLFLSVGRVLYAPQA